MRESTFGQSTSFYYNFKVLAAGPVILLVWQANNLAVVQDLVMVDSKLSRDFLLYCATAVLILVLQVENNINKYIILIFLYIAKMVYNMCSKIIHQ